jgi:hypothetical protein
MKTETPPAKGLGNINPARVCSACGWEEPSSRLTSYHEWVMPSLQFKRNLWYREHPAE